MKGFRSIFLGMGPTNRVCCRHLSEKTSQDELDTLDSKSLDQKHMSREDKNCAVRLGILLNCKKVQQTLERKKNTP